MHAFPARNLDELPGFWENEPSPPSDLLALIQSERLAPIPAELDALIASLLRIEPAERLASTAELIDRLNAIAELEPEAAELTVQGYLNSKAFVGRERERERGTDAAARSCATVACRHCWSRATRASDARASSKSWSVTSQLESVLPVVADSRHGARPYGVAETLLLGLLRALPEPTRRACAEHAVLLSSISKELRAELRVSKRPSLLYAANETRVRTLSALRDVVLALCREHALALFVDDVQAIDEESQALLTTLAHAEAGHQLMIVVALTRDAKAETTAALANLRGHATRIRLLPLSASELLELLRSVFGQAPYLGRLAERLHRASEGNPAYCLELAQHLVQTGAAHYQDGTWTLPVELTPGSLPQSRQAAHVVRLERISSRGPRARSPAQHSARRRTLGRALFGSLENFPRAPLGAAPRAGARRRAARAGRRLSFRPRRSPSRSRCRARSQGQGARTSALG